MRRLLELIISTCIKYYNQELARIPRRATRNSGMGGAQSKGGWGGGEEELLL
jgi:hypothetical protein